MLSNLHIENIAVIEKVDVDFNNGFNVITGETGAGKSIIIDSINAILGKRTSKDLIRAECERGFVSALFTDVCTEVIQKLAELGFCNDPEDTDTVLLQRTISSDGKSSFKINTRPATASALREIGNYLIDIHGQNDNQSLLLSSYYYQYLDKMANNSHIYSQFLESYNQYKTLYKQRKNLLLNEEDKSKRIEYLSSLIDELTKADIAVGEKEELLQKQAILQNAEKIISSVNLSESLLAGNDDSDGCLGILSNAISALNSAVEHYPKLSEIKENFQTAYINIEENLFELTSAVKNINYDYSESQTIEERLDLIFKLTKKYDTSADGLAQLLNESISEYDRLTSTEQNLEEIDLRLNELKNKTIELAFSLSESRKSAAKVFEKSVIDELNYLDMPNARFEVSFKTKSLDAIGLDEIDFLISVNPGENLKPLSETASGGELSRIMLSIKNILSKLDVVETMIFDEIDTGTSGKSAAKIGNKLHAISTDKQVICITHLAQIAALADNHLLIKKQVKDGRTCTSVETLDTDARCNELARIMGGEVITESTLFAAREMMGLGVDN